MRTTHRKRAAATPVIGSFFDHAQIGLAVLALDDPQDPGSLRVVAVNEAAGRIAAVPPGLVGKRASEIPEAAQLDVLQHVARVIIENRPADLGDIPGLFLPNRMFMVKAFPIPPDCCGLVFEDVTERRHNERQLARAQELARMGSWTWDVGSDGIQWSDEMYRIYGVPRETFKATFGAFLERVHPDDRSLVEASVKETLETGRPFHHRERIIRPNGEVRILDSMGEVILGANGQAMQLVGLCRDVTEDARALQALGESEQRFRRIFEASPAAICVFEPASGRLIDVNPRFVELVGYGSSAALVGKRIDSLGMWTEQDEFPRLMDRLREARSLRETTVTYRTYGGQVRRALVALELIDADGEERALGLFLRA